MLSVSPQRPTHLRRHTLLQGGVHLLLQLRANPTHHVHLRHLSVEVYVSAVLQFEKPNLIIWEAKTLLLVHHLLHHLAHASHHGRHTFHAVAAVVPFAALTILTTLANLASLAALTTFSLATLKAVNVRSFNVRITNFLIGFKATVVPKPNQHQCHPHLLWQLKLEHRRSQEPSSLVCWWTMWTRRRRGRFLNILWQLVTFCSVVLVTDFDPGVFWVTGKWPENFLFGFIILTVQLGNDVRLHEQYLKSCFNWYVWFVWKLISSALSPKPIEPFLFIWLKPSCTKTLIVENLNTGKGGRENLEVKSWGWKSWSRSKMGLVWKSWS